MPSFVFDALLEEKIENFKKGYIDTAKRVFYDQDKEKLIHPGEYGVYREIMVKEFLQFIIPQKVAIDSGFLITQKDNISTQCDIIIYHKNLTPLIESGERQKFFPVETVVGIGEVKSTLSKQMLGDALKKLSRVKKLRDDIERPNILRKIAGDKNKYEPMFNPYDNIFSFLICQKLEFNLKEIITEINETFYNKDLAYPYRHNIILSIEDGIILYDLPHKDGNIPFHYPTFCDKGNLNARFIAINTDKPLHHFKTFAHFIFNGISDATILYADIAHYMVGFEPIEDVT